jgi:hypothetical protein
MTSAIVVTTHSLSAENAKGLVDELGGGSDLQIHVAVPEAASSESVDEVFNNWELSAASGRGAVQTTGQELTHSFGDTPERVAKQVLHDSLLALEQQGARADGEVTPHHPLESIGDMVAHHHPDEVIVMVRHHHLSELTASDLAGRIKHKFGVKTLRVKGH